MRNTLYCLFFFCFSLHALAQQETVVTGRVREKDRQEPIPFVSIGFKGTTIGTTSDFEGNFTLRTTQPVDSIIVTYVGYTTVRRAINRGQRQNITIDMQEQTNDLLEVVVTPGENPALRIIRGAEAHRDQNDQRNLTAYEYDSYSKMDLSLNNISDQMKNKKIFKPIRDLFDTAYQMKNEEGKYILPVFISETYSRYYYQRDPSKTKEIVKASSSTGIGVTEKSYVTDLLGTSFVQFNFNQNWLRILGKDFISPIASGGNSYYIYTLLDSVDIDGMKCYKIKLNLRREEDLGFLGTIWITDSTFAIKRIHVEISPNANLNFIDRMKIQQEMMPTATGQWLPAKTRMIIEIARIREDASGMVAKLYTSNSNTIVNTPKPASFYDFTIEKADDVYEKDSTFWQSVRPEQFTAIENQMFQRVDSVRNLPVVKTYIDIVRTITEGYYRIGGFDWGPYIFLYGYNAVEGNRFRIGFKTNQFFNQHLVLRAYVAYGTRDEKFKYSLGTDYIFSRRRWTAGGISYKYDYDLLGITDVPGVASNLFATANIINPRARINETIEYRAHFITAPKRDWTFRAVFQNNYFKPLGRFAFAYDPDLDLSTPVMESFTNTLVTVEARYAYKETMVVRGNDRVRLVASRVPVLTLQYGRGLKGVFGGQFNYNRVSLNISQHLGTGFLGNADFSLTGGKIFGSLPYPLLDIPRGNQSAIYSDYNFSLMNLYEFVSDEFVHLFYIQHFEGLFFNRIPVLKKLGWRNFAAVKGAYGHLSDENARKNFVSSYDQLAPPVKPGGERLSAVHVFTDKPYVEACAGIENIFHFMSLSYVQRLTYNSPSPRIRNWGINVGFRFAF